MKKEIITIVIITSVCVLLSGLLFVPIVLGYYFPDKKGYTCESFSSKKQANVIYAEDKSSNKNLDRNHNGIACDSLQ